MDPLFLTLFGAVVIALLVIIVLLVRRSPDRSGDQAQSVLLLQQQFDNFRSEVAQSLKNSADLLAGGLKTTSETVNAQLSLVTNQLASVTQQLQTNTGDMGTRLDNAARVIQDVQGRLGELNQATREIKELGQSVSKLEEMLKAPKFRGGLGELLLEDLLKQVLTSTFYETQYTFKGGQTVDAIIKLATGWVPIDSKFPLENFRKMVDAKSDQEKRTASRGFVADVKKHIDAIASKYILPDEGTFDFALMYIPAENIYYETIIKDDAFGEEGSLFSYATSRHVVPVSPNSFYAHLMVIAQGLKGLQIERSAREIYQNLRRLVTELQKFSDIFETLGTQLSNAKNNYDKADKQLSSFTDRLKNIQAAPDDASQTQLSAFSSEAHHPEKSS